MHAYMHSQLHVKEILLHAWNIFRCLLRKLISTKDVCLSSTKQLTVLVHDFSLLIYSTVFVNGTSEDYKFVLETDSSIQVWKPDLGFRHREHMYVNYVMFIKGAFKIDSQSLI